MGKYAGEEWYLRKLSSYLNEYGEVPPPWVYEPAEHPYSGFWRMGGGQDHIMVLGEWSSNLSFDERVAYLKRHPTRPRWYEWFAGFLWEQDTFGDDAVYDKLTALGFKNLDQVEIDLDREEGSPYE